MRNFLGRRLGDGVVPASSPQWVLTEIMVEDGRPDTEDQIQTLDYAELRYDWKTREYIGARMAQTIDDPDGEQVLTRKLFHQSRELRPRLQLEEVEDKNGAVLRTEETTWIPVFAVAENGADMSNAWFPQPTQTVTRIFDPADTGTFQERIVDREFDAATGNLTKSIDWGPDGAIDTEDDYAGIFVYFVGVPDLKEDWLVSYPYVQAEYLGGVSQGTQGKLQVFAYDESDWGIRPSRGSLTMRLTQLPDTAMEEWDYDAFGNQTHYYDALNR